MRFSHFGLSFVAAIALLSCNAPADRKADNAANTASAASAAPAAGLWKKMVTRDVDMNESEDTMAHHLKEQNGDTALYQMFVGAVRSGKITAYNNVGAFFSNKLSDAELKSITETKVDTVVITDPVTGASTTSAVPRDFKYNAIHRYRILEQWDFSPSTGKTDIQIVGIGPLMDLYTENISGLTRVIFWMRFDDAKTVLAAYEQLHPGNTLAAHIWTDYFKTDVKPTAQK